MLSFIFFTICFSKTKKVQAPLSNKTIQQTKNNSTEDLIDQKISELIYTVQYLRSEVSDIYFKLLVTTLVNEISYWRSCTNSPDFILGSITRPHQQIFYNTKYPRRISPVNFRSASNQKILEPTPIYKQQYTIKLPPLKNITHSNETKKSNMI